MFFVSATVIQGDTGRALLPWEIFQCHSDALTIREFIQLLFVVYGVKGHVQL